MKEKTIILFFWNLSVLAIHLNFVFIIQKTMMKREQTPPSEKREILERLKRY